MRVGWAALAQYTGVSLDTGRFEGSLAPGSSIDTSYLPRSVKAIGSAGVLLRSPVV